MNKTANGLAAAILIVGAAAFGVLWVNGHITQSGGTVAAAAGPESSPSVVALPPETQVKVNAEGKTYGSAAGAKSRAEEPDLIAVIATNGEKGYVWKTDLYAGQPKNPEEAAKMVPKERVIPVYKSDGHTKIGEFVVGVPSTVRVR